MKVCYKQQKTKAGDKFTLPPPSMKASITMEETTEFAVHAGMFPTSMKVFRISGRDWDAYFGVMVSISLNESLPHKRKRPAPWVRVCASVPWPQ